MKRIWVVILFPTALLASWDDHQVFETAMVQALSNKAVLASTPFTNQLAQFIQSDANVNDRATATLVLAISMAELFEQTLDDTLFLGSRELATAIPSFENLAEDSWQRLHSDLLLAGSYTMDDKYLPAYNILTNTLRVIEQTGYTDPINSVLEAIHKFSYEMPDLTLQQILSLYAAFSITEIGIPSEARVFVAKLPIKYRELIEEFITGTESHPRLIQEATAEAVQPPVAVEKTPPNSVPMTATQPPPEPEKTKTTPRQLPLFVGIIAIIGAITTWCCFRKK